MADAAECKIILRSVLVANPLQLTVSQLSIEFEKTAGYKIPYQQFGFQDFEGYLASIRDILRVDGHGRHALVTVVVGHKSAHVAELIAKQVLPKSKNNRLRFNRYGGGCNYGFQNNFPPRQKARRIFEQPPAIPHNYIDKTTNNSMIHSTTIKENASNYKDKLFGVVQNQTINETPTISNLKVTELNFTPAVSYPKVAELNDTPTFSSSKVTELYYTPTVSSPKVPELNETPYFSASEGEEEDDGAISQTIINYKVPYKVQENLRIILDAYPDGIWCTQLFDVYKQKFNEEIHFMLYGYTSLIQMCADLNYIFHHVQVNKGDSKLYDVRRQLPDVSFDLVKQYHIDNVNYESPPTKPALPDNFQDYIGIKNERSDVLKMGGWIPRQTLDEKEKDTIEIRIAEVYDPSKYWFNLESVNDQLNKLMDDLQNFYTIQSNYDRYEVPESCLEEGLYCAVVFFNEYHRGVIVNLMPQSENRIKVFFIDYGTVSPVLTTGICYLQERFTHLPAQALRGRLAKIYPPTEDSQWSRESAAYFLELIMQRPLVAVIDRIDSKRDAYELIVADTNSEKDIYINDALVFAGHAIFTYEDQQKVEVIKHKPIIQYIHLFPTFHELEEGIVPTASETNTIVYSGIGLHSAYPHYFTNCSNEESQTSADVETANLNEIDTNSSIGCDTPTQINNPDDDNIVEKCVNRPPPGFENVQPIYNTFANIERAAQMNQAQILLNNSFAQPAYPNMQHFINNQANLTPFQTNMGQFLSINMGQQQQHMNQFTDYRNPIMFAPMNQFQNVDPTLNQINMNQYINVVRQNIDLNPLVSEHQEYNNTIIPNVEKKRVIKTKLHGRTIHVILYDNKSYVSVGDIQKNFGKHIIPLPKLRRSLVLETDVTLKTLNLKLDRSLASELNNFQLLDSDSSINVLKLEELLEVMIIINNTEVIPAQVFSDFCKLFDYQSDVWISS